MSPLEMSDFERIEQAITKAAALQQRSIERVESAIDRMMPRLEYEKRHEFIEGQILNNATNLTLLNTRVTDLAKWEIEQHEKLGESIVKVQEDVDDKFDQIIKGQSASREATLRYIVSVIVSFIIGGGLLSLVEFLLTRR